MGRTEEVGKAVQEATADPTFSDKFIIGAVKQLLIENAQESKRVMDESYQSAEFTDATKVELMKLVLHRAGLELLLAQKQKEAEDKKEGGV